MSLVLFFFLISSNKLFKQLRNVFQIYGPYLYGMNDTDWFLLTWCVGVITNVPKSIHFSHIYILEINLMHHLFVVKLNKKKSNLWESYCKWFWPRNEDNEMNIKVWIVVFLATIWSEMQLVQDKLLCPFVDFLWLRSSKCHINSS